MAIFECRFGLVGAKKEPIIKPLLNMWHLQAILLLVVYISSYLVHPCGGQCQIGMAMTCMLDSLNMTSDGIATLRKIPPNMFYSIKVEIVRMPENPSGVFLQRMAEFVNQVQMYTYHEPVFQLLSGTSLSSISVYSAPALVQLLVAPTVNVSALHFTDCALDRVPPTIDKLQPLESLTVSRCKIRTFSFDTFINNPKLIDLDLSNNEIQTIVPTTIQTPFDLAIENLYLSWNRLENVDMTAFVSLAALRGLDLSHNNLMKVAALSTVTWPNIDFLNLESNQLKTLDLQWLSAPNLQRLQLSDNGFESIPQRLRRFPSLQLVGLSNNLFKSIDLAPFNGLPNLNSIDLSYNAEARGIRVSRPTSMPMLSSLYAENCGLQRFNTSGLDLPVINYISLTGNNFTAVPRLAAAFPSLGSFSLEKNPLSCATVQTTTELIMSGRLILGLPRDPKSCTDGYVTLKGSLTLCCKA